MALVPSQTTHRYTTAERFLLDHPNPQPNWHKTIHAVRGVDTGVPLLQRPHVVGFQTFVREDNAFVLLRQEWNAAAGQHEMQPVGRILANALVVITDEVPMQVGPFRFRVEAPDEERTQLRFPVEVWCETDPLPNPLLHDVSDQNDRSFSLMMPLGSTDDDAIRRVVEILTEKLATK